MDGDAAAVPGSYPGGSASPTRPSKKATVDALRTDLASLGLDTKGKKDTLFRRLMGWWTTRVEPASEADKPGEADTEEVVGIERLLPAPKQPFSSFLCFDVEATCEAGVNFDYPNEIIEFPVVLLQWADEEPPTPAEAGPSASAKATAHGQRKQRVRRLVKVDTFHTYVRPTWQPRLSEFCTGLTGITQETVDTAPTFPEALLKLEDWMDSWGLRDGDQLRDAMWVTDGPWDLRDFIPKQLHITPTSPPRYPAYLLAPYLNIKTAVQSYLTETHKRSQGYPDESPSKLSSARSSPAGKKRPKDKIVGRLTTGHVTSRTTKDRFKAMGIDYYLNIKGMLKALEIGEFEGHLHSGIDDATNVARILIAIANQDVLIEPNSRLPPPKNAKQWSRLEGLGAHKLVESIWGDERAPDGYEETFVPWLKQILDTVLPYLPIALASTSLKATELPPPIFRLKSLDASAITAAISEDVPVSESTWAWCPEGWTWATLVRNERVTPKEWWQDVREVHLEPDLPTAYPPGSICSLIPQSGPEEVERFIDVTGLADVADRPFALESTVDHPLPPHLPRTPTTLRALLLNHLDLRSPPRKSFFEWLRRFCEPSQDREIDRLDEFIADPDEVHTYATRSKRTIVETLAEFNTIKIPLEYVCELVPGIRRRQFSIAGSAEKHGGKVELLVTLVEYKTNLKIPRRGLCSSWLEGLQPGTRLAIRIDQPTLELPSAETPLILVGPGTGVAPMRALVETRIRQQASETALYFGHRMSTADAYYASEWEAWRQCGVRVEIAASRDGPEKVYVQHLIKRDSVMIRDWLKRGAWVMISGSSNTMPRQVREALAYALSKEAGGDMDASEAGAYVEAMFDSERGQEESW
ncbi:NAPDH-dependent diflavin reductase [Cryptotrichosporon argae]